jgi:MFS family permease
LPDIADHGIRARAWSLRSMRACRRKVGSMPDRHGEDLMEDPAARGPHLNSVLARLGARLDWYWTLSPAGRAAFWATFGGWALDAYNQMTVGFVLPAVTAAFALSPAQAGLLGSVGLVTSAVGGAVAGALADALGRVRVLILSIASYALFTLLAGCAQSYEQLLLFLTLQGLGFGGEWAAGAVLVAEYADATQRGRVVGSVQSAWSIGYAGVLLANTITFSLAPPEFAWRIMFWLGALPAVALLWVRTGIEESPLYRAEAAARARGAGQAGAKPGAKTGAALLGLFRRDQLRITLASALSRSASSAPGLSSGCRPISSRCAISRSRASPPTWASR